MSRQPVHSPGADTLARALDLIRASRPRCGSIRVIAVDGPSGSGKTTLAADLADALDASHLDLVEGLSCQVGPEKVLVTCVAGQPPQGEDEAWARKGALFRSFFGREAELRWTLRG